MSQSRTSQSCMPTTRVHDKKLLNGTVFRSKTVPASKAGTPALRVAQTFQIASKLAPIVWNEILCKCTNPEPPDINAARQRLPSQHRIKKTT